MRRLRRVTIEVPESLHKKLEQVRLKFKEVNGYEITLREATDIFGKNASLPRIPCVANIFKNETNKYKKKGRSY